MRPKLEASLEAKGFVVLNWVDGGWVHFFTKKPVAVPDDLRALKLFSWAGDAQAVEVWRSAGFNPVPLPSTEISTALQTGLVEALGSPPQVAVISQFFTHATEHDRRCAGSCCWARRSSARAPGRRSRRTCGRSSWRSRARRACGCRRRSATPRTATSRR